MQEAIEQFKHAMEQRGLVPPAMPVSDGEIHRCDTVGKAGRNDGAYMLHLHDHPAGGFQNHRDGKDWENWSFRGEKRELSPAENAAFQQKVEADKQKREAERQQRHGSAATRAEREFSAMLPEGMSSYLQRKQVESYGIRFDGDDIAIPLHDSTGRLWNYQRIKPDGQKRFLSGGKKKGCFHIIGDLGEAKAAYVAEGYSTGASIHAATDQPVIVAFDAGNLEPAIAEIRAVDPNLSLTIAADSDCWPNPETGQASHTGETKARDAAEKHGCGVILPEFSESAKEHQPTDFNDLHCLHGLDEVRRQLEAPPESAKPTDTTALPSGFSIIKGGLYFDMGKEDSPEWICTPAPEVLAYTRDENNENWGRLVRFRDLDGHVHERAIPMEIMSGDCTELYALFLSLGLRLTTKKSNRSKLADYLQSMKIAKRATCTSRIGWHGDHFILPDGAIPETDAIYLQSDNSNFTGFRNAGTLQEWQEHIATPCQGNTRLVFSLSCAFAAPMLPLLHLESGGFNLKGASSIGKSTALAVAASVWGSPKNYIQQWKATGNALEAMAEAHHNALLCLDELGQVDGREAGEISYMLANGSGKNRLKAKGGLRKKYEWNLLFFSTGEISIADKINEAGKKVQAGMLARMADIPADAGKGHRLFDTIHNFRDGNALANHFKTSAGKYYGTAIRAFLPPLAALKAQLPDKLKEIERDFFAEYVSSDADGQVRRVAQRFVMVAAAGELAIRLGILPYPVGEAFGAAGACFQGWLEGRGSTGAYETEEAVKQVRAFIEAHHSSRFAAMGGESDTGSTAEEKIINQAGYKRRAETGNYEFFVYPEIFRKEICRGFDVRTVCNELVSRGLLLRGDERQYVKTQRLPIGRKKIYHLAPAILTEAVE